MFRSERTHCPRISSNFKETPLQHFTWYEHQSLQQFVVNVFYGAIKWQLLQSYWNYHMQYLGVTFYSSPQLRMTEPILTKNSVVFSFVQCMHGFFHFPHRCSHWNSSILFIRLKENWRPKSAIFPKIVFSSRFLVFFFFCEKITFEVGLFLLFWPFQHGLKI